jgi:hypothetical protein
VDVILRTIGRGAHACRGASARARTQLLWTGVEEQRNSH